MENKLIFRNPHDDKQNIADFNLELFKELCNAAKELSLNYQKAVEEISSRVLVFGEDFNGPVEDPSCF